MKIKIVEAETVVIVEYPYRLNDRIALDGVIGKKYFMDYKRNDEMTYLYKLVEFEQRNDW
jgi:hypothetical protein